MPVDTVLTLLNVVWGLLLTGIGIEMVNNPPGDIQWKRWLYRVLFMVFGCAVIVTTGFQSVHNSNEQQHLRDDAQKTEKDLSNKVSEQGGKLDAISHFEQQFLTFVSQSQRAPGSPDAATKAYEAMALAVMKMAQGSPLNTGNLEAKREIQKMLAQLSDKGSDIREKWTAVKGTPEDSQRPYAKQVHLWNATVENYLRTIPRGSVYLASLHGALKTGSGGYTVGINPNLYDDWDLLANDLAMLNEFMNDPQLGEP